MMTEDNLFCPDDAFREEEGIDKYLIMASELEHALGCFRRRVWNSLAFDEKARHAEVMRFLSVRIAKAAERLRDADRELRLAVDLEHDYAVEVSELRERVEKLRHIEAG